MIDRIDRLKAAPDAVESEKRTLSLLVETSFYPNAAPASDAPVAVAQVDVLLQQLQHDPSLTHLLLQKLLSNALGASTFSISKFFSKHNQNGRQLRITKTP